MVHYTARLGDGDEEAPIMVGTVGKRWPVKLSSHVITHHGNEVNINRDKKSYFEFKRRARVKLSLTLVSKIYFKGVFVNIWFF